MNKKTANKIPASSISNRFDDTYFDDRFNTDKLRELQFKKDIEFVLRNVRNGKLCDIGCSTGEFTKNFSSNFDLYGMEVNQKAIEAAQDTICFSRNIFSEINFFDVIIFRGTIQHLDEPFRYIKTAYNALKPGGKIIFLSTPNHNSPFFRATKTLPFLDPPRNIYIPSDLCLVNALRNYGYEKINIEYPYLSTPYARPVLDHIRFVINFINRKLVFKHAFWRSSMNIVAAKPL